jgi:ABC-type bacteriocin/lantibiotic exporter with double-glycine peptidase domain
MLSNTNGIVSFCIARLGTVQESLAFLREILKKKRKRTLTNVINEGNIEFKNIVFKYSEGSKIILNDVSFKINKQEKVAIIGRSGSGKTTCMKMLIGIHQPNSGNIYVDNKNIKDIKFEHLRENVVYINQRTNLFQDSVLNNIKFGNDVTTKEIEYVIKKYQLETVYAGLNEGLETNTGVNGGNLSLGMQKVTILLRGIFKKCKIIIFDEPLAGLDANTRQKVIKLITEQCSDKTVVVITHDKEILPYMNRIINISDLNNHSSSNNNRPIAA